jgi:hypothetical protein
MAKARRELVYHTPSEADVDPWPDRENVNRSDPGGDPAGVREPRDPLPPDNSLTGQQEMPPAPDGDE